jgi:TolA-binding protein
MEQTLRTYNLAINYLQEERYEEAALFLEPIVKEYPSLTEAKWALGLLHVLSGFPHKALQLWGQIQHFEGRNLLTCQQTVEEKLPQYDELYGKYNQALEWVQVEDFHQAKGIFQELLSYQEEVPLPIDFYHGYLLAQIVTGEEESASRVINSFPLYVKNSFVIREIEKTIGHLAPKQTSFEEIAVAVKAPDKGRSKGLFIATGMAASLLVGAIGTWALSETKDVNNQKPVIQQNVGDVTKGREKTENLEKELSALKEEKSNLQNNLEAKNQELSKEQELSDLISYANLDREELSAKAGWNTYKNGLAAFKNKDYNKTADLMEKSLTLEPNEYFSDDALYFLIKSKQRLNMKEDLPALYDRFFSQTSSHYALSPYKAELMLGNAQLLIEQGNSKDALPLLEKIQSENKHDWTAEEAALIINRLIEGPK